MSSDIEKEFLEREKELKAREDAFKKGETFTSTGYIVHIPKRKLLSEQKEDCFFRD